MKSVNRNHWSDSEVETLLTLGYQKAYEKLGRTYIACRAKYYYLKNSTSSISTKHNRYELEDKVFILTNSTKLVMLKYKVTNANAKNRRTLAKNYFNSLRTSDSIRYQRMSNMIVEAGGFWKEKRLKPDYESNRNFKALKDKLIWYTADRQANAEELPVEPVSVVDRIIAQEELKEASEANYSWWRKIANLLS